jgi:uncharacterized protein involved in exopolysaccharide biosynthesis
MRELDPGPQLVEKPLPHLSLRDLAAPLFRRKWVLIITFLGVFAIAGLAGLVMSPQYTSRMSVLVNRERIDPVVTTGATTQLVTDGNPVSEEEINSEAELLKSRDVLERVVLENDLQKRQHEGSLLGLLHSGRSGADRVESAVAALAKNIKVDVGTKTDLINVTYSSSDPRLSYAVLKTLGILYLQKHVAVHRPPGSYEFFAEETEKYQQALDQAESRLRNFEKLQGAAAPDLERADMAMQVTNAVGQMHATVETIAADEQRIRSDQRQLEVTPQRSATKQDVNAADMLLQQLGSALLTAQTKRTQLLAKYDSNYPLVREANQEVADAKAAIDQAEKNPYVNQETDRDPTFEWLREDLVKTQADLAAQRSNLVAIRSGIAGMQSQMVDLDQKAVTQQDLLRDVKANEDNYLLYLAKREQARTSDALDKTRIANVAIAVPPAIPALPTHGFLFFVFSGFALAILLAISAAYISDYFDSSFHTPVEVMDTLGIPVVVAVPKKTA